MSTEKELTGYPTIDKPWLKYYSEEAIHAELPQMTMYDYLYESNENNLGKTALNYMGVKISFKELFEGIDRAAKAYSSIGVSDGDYVVMASVTTPETVYSIYALNRLGAVVNMVDPRTATWGIREYIDEVKAKYIVTISLALPKIIEATSDMDVEKIIVISPVDALSRLKKSVYNIVNKLKGVRYTLTNKCVSWNDFVEKSSLSNYVIPPYTKDKCCVVVHTGGTTGFPKGVMLSNDNINALVMQSILTGIDMKREHTWMDIMPPFIAYGVGMGLHLPLVIGMETILIPSFDAKKFDELLLKHKPVHMVGVPSYWGTIIKSKKLKREDLSYMIAPTVGGDSMDTELEKAANRYLEQHNCASKITKGYGMTEVSAGVAGTVDANNEIGSVGIPFVKTLISVFDPETGEELKYGELGEICISSPNVMIGYYDNRKATDEIIRFHNDGLKWLHSGDLGYMNENGSIFIVDRIKRMIIRYDGFKVFPRFIEDVILQNKEVESCCVIGIPDKQHSQGKLPYVFVVCKNREIIQEKLIQELSKLCKAELPEYAMPVGFSTCESFPLTNIGKVDYRKLEEMATSI